MKKWKNPRPRKEENGGDPFSIGHGSERCVDQSEAKTKHKKH